MFFLPPTFFFTETRGQEERDHSIRRETIERNQYWHDKIAQPANDSHGHPQDGLDNYESRRHRENSHDYDSTAGGNE